MQASTSTSRCGAMRTGRCNRVPVAAPASRAAPRVVMRSASSSEAKLQPDWTGDNVLSRLVNWMINTPALYGLMKVMAKNAMKSSAESRGIRWASRVKELESTPEIYKIKEEIENKSVQYPDYYLKPFHAYDEGNLNWLAAFEVEPASYAMAIRTFKTETEAPAQYLFDKLRKGITDTFKNYMKSNGVASPRTILDVGCSTGISTRFMAQEFPDADITGLDLSPHFLAVAEYEERKRAAPRRIKYVHGLAENSGGLPDKSVDFLVYNFVTHECPQAAIVDFIREGRRVVKKGGVFSFVDNNPQSKTIQNLPPFIFTLMKSTEPWSDEYYSFDMEKAMRDAGFTNVVTVETDHRHRAVMGISA